MPIRGTVHQLLTILVATLATYTVIAADPESWLISKSNFVKSALKMGSFCLGTAALMIVSFCAFKHAKRKKRHRGSDSSSTEFLDTIVIGPPPPIPEDFPSPPPVRIYHKPIPFITSEIEEKHEPLSQSLQENE